METQLAKCLQEFGLKEKSLEVCLELILKGDEKYAKKVKSDQRESLKSKVNEILQHAKREKPKSVQKKGKITIKIDYENNPFIFQVEKDLLALKNLLKSKLGITSFNDYSFSRNDQPLTNLENILDEVEDFLSLKVENKIQVWYEFHEEPNMVKVSKNASNKEVKQTILQ